MSDRPLYYLRVHARWYPIGPRFVVRCGRADDHQSEVPMLTPDGWKPITDEMRITPSADWPTLYGALVYTDIRTADVQGRLSPLGLLLVEDIFERAMMEPRLWEGVTYEQVVHEDPRVGWAP